MAERRSIYNEVLSIYKQALMSALKGLLRWRRPRPTPAAGRYAPRLGEPWWVLPLAVISAGVVLWGTYLLLRHFADPRTKVLDLVKAAVGVAAFFGAVLAGVYAYRKQRLAEGDARRSDAEQLAARYTGAAEQLGDEKAAVRLAGVYAMARLADDWPEERQTCIDVLCAYLRMPYDPAPESSGHRVGEREVRHTIIRVIRDHLQESGAATTWCGRNLDFTGAVFDGGNFADARFSAGRVSFDGAKFLGKITFGGAEFSGGAVSFRGAEFSGGAVSFGATFSGGSVSFAEARFSGGLITFINIEQVSGETITFRFAGFSGGNVDFVGAEFSGGKVNFVGAQFTGGRVSFSEAKFSGSEVGFPDAGFSTGGWVTFAHAGFSGGEVDFQSVGDWSSPPRFDFTDPPPGVLLPSQDPDPDAQAASFIDRWFGQSDTGQV